MKIVPKDFAEKKLVPMAGYRNRLTHFYAEINARELHKILKENLGDVEIFLTAIKKLLKNPKKFGLEVE